MFKKLLVVNRGEIARRIFLTCRELGIRSVAIYSEADAGAPWVRMADECYPLAGSAAVDTYLNQEAIFRIAKSAGVDAIHPGYGFLSENADFAAACAAHDICFVGPSPEAMRVMGSKAAARLLAEGAGVPVVPGVDGAQLSADELRAAADAIGYPVLIKASAGGGGKGMRVVWSGDAFADALRAAQREAASAFGNDHVLIEKYFTEIHHVEIQILGDHFGNCLHLFERECSIQRRHQKIIEESPAPIVTDDNLRHAIAGAAVRLATAASYTNAGTVEFIVDDRGGFYFLEMNTRLQVEHPVTEMVTGLDLAAWQIRIAAGEALPYAQSDITQRGHAIECRLYAEDPANGFLPSIGEIACYERPSGPGVRVDDGIATGTAVSPYYDPMLAKVITWGYTRDEAIDKMVRALRDTIVLGVTTNIPYLLAILDEPHFRRGATSTSYLADHMPDWQPADTAGDTAWLAAIVYELARGGVRSGAAPAGGAVETGPDPWDLVGHGDRPWRNVMLP